MSAPTDFSKHLDLIGKLGDAEVAKIVGCSRLAVFNFRKKNGISGTKNRIDWRLYDPLLGVISDSDLAAKIGCGVSTVYSRRIAKNITRPKRVIDWTKYDAMLGTVPDIEIANKIGCLASSVRIRRNKLNIKPFRENNAKSEDLKQIHFAMFLTKKMDHAISKEAKKQFATKAEIIRIAVVEYFKSRGSGCVD